MSMHYHMPDQAVPADSWMLFCPECSQKMRIIMAEPAQDGLETRTYECVYGHRERITATLDQLSAERMQRTGKFQATDLQKLID